jgi:hypothetical protein
MLVTKMKKMLHPAYGEEMGQLIGYRAVRYVRFLPSLDASLLPSDSYRQNDSYSEH